ncbi:MAG: BlaI/MecI/CopY family transcriptional regulator, partial [Cyanobacteria bacterium J06648_11]
MNQPHRYRPRQLSLGPLEREILELVWAMQGATVREVHDRILADPDRELTYSSVTTVLRRLTDKGWLKCDKQDRTFYWQPRVSRPEAQSIWAQDQLEAFLAVGNPDVVAAFADRIDVESIERLDAIAQRLKA